MSISTEHLSLLATSVCINAWQSNKIRHIVRHAIINLVLGHSVSIQPHLTGDPFRIPPNLAHMYGIVMYKPTLKINSKPFWPSKAQVEFQEAESTASLEMDVQQSRHHYGI